jgi:hypothetical protein
MIYMSKQTVFHREMTITKILHLTCGFVTVLNQALEAAPVHKPLYLVLGRMLQATSLVQNEVPQNLMGTMMCTIQLENQSPSFGTQKKYHRGLYMFHIPLHPNTSS